MGLTSARYYGLDALRTCMMLLGIFLHLAVPYTGFPSPGSYLSEERSWALQAALIIIHYFRMPAFFLLSGFFSAMIWERKGPRDFLLIKVRRVGLVWIAALALLSPITAVVCTYNHFAALGDDAILPAWTAVTSLQVDSRWLQDPPLHLWFLEYLMLFCIIASAIFSLSGRFLPFIDRCTEKVINSPIRVLPLAIPTCLSMSGVPLPIVPYPSSFIPWMGVFSVYGWFYLVGWLFYRRRDSFLSLTRSTRIEQVAIPLLILTTVVLGKWRLRIGVTTSAPALDIAIRYLTALFIWSTIVVFIAMFHRVRPARQLPYLADASYWIYLVHYPLALLVPTLLRHWSAPPMAKVGLFTIVILLVLLTLYDWCIRYTVVGRMLNGPRSRSPEKPKCDWPQAAVAANHER